MKAPCQEIQQKSEDIFQKCFNLSKDCLEDFQKAANNGYSSISMKNINKHLNIIEKMKDIIKTPKNKDYETLYQKFIPEIKRLREELVDKTNDFLDSILTKEIDGIK